MPCNSDYLERTHREKEIVRAARLLVYLLNARKKPMIEWVYEESGKYYGTDDRVIFLLCDEIKSMTEIEKNNIIYNAYSRTARDLANWWEEHQEADRMREQQERDEVERKKLKLEALSKLTKEEKTALGL